MRWTEQQERVFEWFASGDGSLVVSARAGSSKTTTALQGLSHARELNSRRVLMCAFNKRIASELAGRAPRGVTVKTMHALGLQSISRAWGGVEVNQDRGQTLARAAVGPQAHNAVVMLVARLASLGKLTLSSTREELEGLAADFDLEPSEKMLEEEWDLDAIVDAAASAMSMALEPGGVIDFDDMVYVPTACQIPVPRHDLVVGDEIQDWNEAQLALAVSALAPGGRLCGLGDPFQAIYEWMGAAPDAVNRVRDTLNAVELPLTVTFRCPQRVAAMARGYVPDLLAAEHALEGAVDELPDLAAMVPQARPGDFVLSRTNAGAVKACLALLRADVRATVIGRDLGAGLLKLLDRAGEDRLPAAIRALRIWTEREAAKAVAAGKERRAEHLTDRFETLLALSEGMASTQDLRRRVETLFREDGTGFVACSTVHAGKGLEADNVFILANTFRPSGDDNVKYVAITRAKKRLVLVADPSSFHRGRASLRAWDADTQKTHEKGVEV